MRTLGRAAGSAFIPIWLVAASAWGFEVETHAKISESAFDQSVLNRNYLEEQVGLELARTLAGTTPKNWLAFGSIHEDDRLRPINHFYDPVNDRGLRTILCGGGFGAHEWAFSQPSEPADLRFGWVDARQSFFIGLTAQDLQAREAAMAKTFRTLGDVIHLIQDMGSPEHTRNDPHAGFGILGWFPCGTNSLFEGWTKERQDAFTYTGYPSPLFPGFNDYWTTGTGLGFAEFTNRSFVSKSTNFTVAEEGTAGRGYTEPRLRLGLQSVMDIRDPSLMGPDFPLEGFVTFFGNDIDDRVTGQTIRNDRMTTYSLFDRDLAARGRQQIFTLNRFNIEAAARILLPRAVGYSAALLDYFFRGKLDVDLVEDPNDPSVVRVSGTNASRDKLDGGALTLYADVPAVDPAQGIERKAATALDQHLAVTAESGAPVVSARFQVPDAERFVAVYQGKLGDEAGGVIGKVLGGVRVEQVFSDGTRWKLRTPTGVFLLPFFVAPSPFGDPTPLPEGANALNTFEEVRWGDGDNTLVARTPFGVDRPNRVVAFEIQRQPGSVEPVTVDTPAGPEAHVTKKTEALFPFGMPLGTTVQFSQTIHYRQQLLRVDPRKTVLRWEPQPTEGCPGCGVYVLERHDIAPLQIEEVVKEAILFSETFRIRLDLEHNANFGTKSEPYTWLLQEVAADASGRLLGVIVVRLETPESPLVTLPFFGLNAQGAREVVSQHSIAPRFPATGSALWAVVDLTEQLVVASTADPTIVITSQVLAENPDWTSPTPREPDAPDPDPNAKRCSSSDPNFAQLVFVHFLEERLGGPAAGLEDRGWGENCLMPVPPGTPLSLTELQNQVGERASADGWLRPELKNELTQQGLLSFHVDVETLTRDFSYDCPSETCFGLRVIASGSGMVGSALELEDARRSRPARGGERLVFAMTTSGPERAGGAVLVWDPSPARAQVLVHAEDDFQLGPATRAAVLATEDVPGQDRGLLIPLEGGQSPIVFEGAGSGFRRNFTVLDPGFLYSLQDLKFYRLESPLQRTALPGKLADLPDGSNPIGDYHAIRLP